jgi:hypothetical protein
MDFGCVSRLCASVGESERSYSITASQGSCVNFFVLQCEMGSSLAPAARLRAGSFCAVA